MKDKLLLFIGMILFLVIFCLHGGESLYYNSLALAILMIFFWVFEVIPIYITALFPLILGIPMGVLVKQDLIDAYGDSNVFLFFGGFLLALGLEKWKVHDQIAKGIIHVVGYSKPRILFGFLLATGLISMWISNTATALMMLPIALGIIHALPEEQKKSRFTLFLLLSVAYASSIGGVGTLIGSPPNTQMASILESEFNIHIDFFSWMKVGFPLSILMLMGTFIFFYFAMGKERNEKKVDFQLVKQPWTSDQLKVAAIFIFVVLLWIAKDLITPFLGFNYRDENVAILGGVLMFLLPSSKKDQSLLVWKDTEKLPWGILLLFGGGLALATIMEKNGLINSLAILFKQLEGTSYTTLLLLVITTAVFASEVLSNLAMVSIFVPLVGNFAIHSGLQVDSLAIPLTLGASLAFMLPVGTPPNAIIFSTGLIEVRHMVKYGFVLNCIGILLMFLCASFLL